MKHKELSAATVFRQFNVIAHLPRQIFNARRRIIAAMADRRRQS